VFICPSCQTENRETAKFCRKCGLPRDEAQPETVAPEPQPVPEPELIAEPEPEPEPAPPRRAVPTCPSCGANVRLADKFCIWCGEKQPQRTRVKMKRCPDCRTQLPLKANFCFVCGADVGPHAKVRVGTEAELFGEEDPELFPKFEA